MITAIAMTKHSREVEALDPSSLNEFIQCRQDIVNSIVRFAEKENLKILAIEGEFLNEIDLAIKKYFERTGSLMDEASFLNGSEKIFLSQDNRHLCEFNNKKLPLEKSINGIKSELSFINLCLHEKKYLEFKEFKAKISQDPASRHEEEAKLVAALTAKEKQLVLSLESKYNELVACKQLMLRNTELSRQIFLNHRMKKFHRARENRKKNWGVEKQEILSIFLPIIRHVGNWESVLRKLRNTTVLDRKSVAVLQPDQSLSDVVTYFKMNDKIKFSCEYVSFFRGKENIGSIKLTKTASGKRNAPLDVPQMQLFKRHGFSSI